MSEIKYKLAGVALTITNFRWGLKGGVNPFETTIEVPDYIADSVWNKRNKGLKGLLTLTFNNNTDNLQIQGLALVIKHRSRKQKGLSRKKEGMSTLTLADRRFYWQKRTWTGRYNQLKIVNDKNMIDGIPKAALDYFTYNVKAYKTWSIQRIEVKNKKGKLIEQYKPWGVVDLIDMIIKTIDPKAYIGIKDPRKMLRNVTPNSLNFEGMPVTQVLEQLLYYARGNIGITRNGKIFIYPIEDEKQLRRIWKTYEDLSLDGIIYNVDWSQFRPRYVTSFFKKEQEVLFDYSDFTRDRTFAEWFNPNRKLEKLNVKTPYIENVVQIPRNMTIEGKSFESGEYIPLRFFLRGLTGPGGYIAEWDIRQGWFVDYVIFHYMQKVKCLTPDLWHHYKTDLEDISTVKTHYRRTFQVHPAWNEQILDIKPVTSKMVDYTIGNRVPSFINTQYLQSVTMRYGAKYVKPNTTYAFNVNEAPIGADADIVLDILPTSAPILLVPVNPELGIYQFKVFRDKHNQIFSYTPSMVEEPIPPGFLEGKGTGWEKVALAEDFRFISRLSAIFATPNNGNQFVKVRVAFKNQHYPEWDIFIHNVNARYDYQGRLDNPEFLKAMSAAQLEKVKYELRNRWVGKASFAGIKKSWVLSGSIDSIIYDLSGGAAKTSISCPIKPPPKDIYNLIPPEIRRKIYGEIDPNSINK